MTQPHEPAPVITIPSLKKRNALWTRLALAALAALIGVNAWLYWPAVWRPTAAGAVLRAGGNVTYLTEAGHEGEAAVLLPESVTDDEVERMTSLDRLRPACLQLQGGAVGNRGLAALGRLKTLRRLSLWGTKVTDEGLAHLRAFPDLELVNLDHCAISDRGLAHLEKLPRLRLASLFQTRITADGVKRLQSARPGLRVKWEGEPDDD